MTKPAAKQDETFPQQASEQSRGNEPCCFTGKVIDTQHISRRVHPPGNYVPKSGGLPAHDAPSLLNS